MRKEDVALLTQLLYAMKESALRLEQSFNNGDHERLASVKKEMLDIQAKIDRLL